MGEVTFDAFASFDGDWWTVAVPTASVATQVRVLADPAAEARRLVADALQVPPDDVTVRVFTDGATPAADTAKPDTVYRLDLGSSDGLWVVRTVTGTTYRFDLDNQRVQRVPNEGGRRSALDGTWVALQGVSTRYAVDQLTVGYGFHVDVAGHGGTYGSWWEASPVVAIRCGPDSHEGAAL